MTLQSRLTKTTMWIKCVGERGSSINRKVSVESWNGLAIHEYGDVLDNTWRVSHIRSGLSILRYLKSRKHAIKYLMMVGRINPGSGVIDWTQSEDWLRETLGLKMILDRIQQEIQGGTFLR